jgi:predicted site-specific integrase-resolvase
VALSEAAIDIKFLVQFSENLATTSRTRHVDVRYHYVREYVEDGFVKIVLVRSEDNLADEFTKNDSGVIQDACHKIYG